MKQTAVEWYGIEINSLIEKYEAKEISIRDFIIMKHNLFYPAKEMEKQQISNAYQIGILDGLNHQPRDYYNETFKNETAV